MMPSKRKARAEDDDDIAAEAQQRAQSAVARTPSSPSAALVPSSSLSPAEAMQWGTPAPGIVVDEGSEDAASSSSAVIFSSPTFASPQPAAAAAASSSVAAVTVPADGQAQPSPLTPFGRLADIEVQLIMQQLDYKSILNLAHAAVRCFAAPRIRSSGNR
jgi:hypothetical protein